MPPFLPRKRARSSSPGAGPSKPPTSLAKKPDKVKILTPRKKLTPRKPTLFDDLDAGTGRKRTVEDGKAMLEKMANATDEESSLSSLSEDDFEQPSTKRQKVSDEEDEDEDEDMEFEDVETHMHSHLPGPSAPEPSGDLVLTLTKETRTEITNPFGTKKGPSKIERQIRIATHQMHVQMLMYHNAIRNSWLCDKGLQEILLEQLPTRVKTSIEKWERDSGLPTTKVEKSKSKGKGKAKAADGKKAPARKQQTAATYEKKASAGKGQSGKKSTPIELDDSETESKEPASSRKPDHRSQRDWGAPAQRLAEGEVDMSRGDPLLHMLPRLVSYWNKRFRITAPGLRKGGYMSLRKLDEESKSFKEDEHDVERHGERIRNLDEFKQCATIMEGSRDVSAQLFTALLRGLGLEARLVASLQPAGFGWSQNEEAPKRNPRSLKKQKVNVDDTSSDDAVSENEQGLVPPGKKMSKSQEYLQRRDRTSEAFNDIINRSRTNVSRPESDDDSVIDVTPGKPKVKPSLPYDKDLLYPHYWSEVLSPATNTYMAVDATVMKVVAASELNLAKFEPRGAKANKAKQVTAYIIGHSQDGTAKDVTTRYLKRQVWPGRTKGNRYPVEKIPIYGTNGKVKRYEQRDWFKTVMSGYVRGSKKCPRTEVDDHEDMTSLKPAKAEKKEVPEGKETLQYYKSSPDFVLERHLKREEALVSNAKHVKLFTIKSKTEDSVSEKVYRRKDVVNCKSQETWHKEGRAPRTGEEPLKRVPYRAATTNRRRELAEAEHAAGAPMLQGLYSRAQTEWIIPPPIENGVIPKNSFGNIDLYVESMLPKGSVHLPYRGMVKICRRLNIDFAEAVTGFEFGRRMAVPVITGVVIPEEHEETIMGEWEVEEAERRRKEDEKRKRVALGWWRKMLMGMRIIERVREEYGELGDGEDEVDISPWGSNRAVVATREKEDVDVDMGERVGEMGGGFVPDGFDAEEPVQERPATFYPGAHEHEGDEEGGGFEVEEHDEPATTKTNGKSHTNQQFVFQSTKADANPDSELEEDDATEMQGMVPPTKKRGRPAPKSAKTKAATKKAKEPTISAKAKGKRKSIVQDSSDDELLEPPTISEPASESESESEPESEAEAEPEPAPKTKAATKKVNTPPISAKAKGKRKSVVQDTPSDELSEPPTSSEADSNSESEAEPEPPKKAQTKRKSAHFNPPHRDSPPSSSSSESEPDSESSSEPAPPKKTPAKKTPAKKTPAKKTPAKKIPAKKAAPKKATPAKKVTPAKATTTAAPRRTPRRTATLKSHYFKHAEDEEDDE